MNQNKPDGEQIEQELPLSEATFLILLSLSKGRKHGYAIMKDVAYLSDARVNMGTGTLYGALGRLLDQGWIERADESQDNLDTGRPRKTYHLTGKGRRLLSAETARLQAILSAAQQRLAEQGF